MAIGTIVLCTFIMNFYNDSFDAQGKIVWIGSRTIAVKFEDNDKILYLKKEDCSVAKPHKVSK
jgi:hypothetical protein